MAWTTPITDRTQADVTYAKANQNNVSDLKGAWNISDANRIIENTIYLKDLLIANGYPCSITNQALFVETDLPYVESKMKILKDNVQSVIDSFYKATNHPIIVYGMNFNYQNANDLELDLDLTNQLLQNMILELKYCGVS